MYKGLEETLSMKLHLQIFRLDIRKRFFTEKVIGFWNSLPREMVIAATLIKFKKCLDIILRYKV